MFLLHGTIWVSHIPQSVVVIYYLNENVLYDTVCLTWYHVKENVPYIRVYWCDIVCKDRKWIKVNNIKLYKSKGLWEMLKTFWWKGQFCGLSPLFIFSVLLYVLPFPMKFLMNYYLEKNIVHQKGVGVNMKVYNTSLTIFSAWVDG